MSAAVEDDAAVGTEDVREARRLAARLGRSRGCRHVLGAEAAIERRTEPFSPTLLFDDPRPQLERRLVAHVLLMAARELGDPVAALVLVIADDRTLHTARVRKLGSTFSLAPMDATWGPDELEYAGVEHRDPAYVAGYDAKTGFDLAPELELLQRLGLGPKSTLVDLGAGTGLLAAAAAPLCRRVVAVDPSPAMLAAARARDERIECVQAGFLTYGHLGDPPDVVYSRNALHHLPDVWKAVALRRIADFLRPAGTLVVRDIVYACEPAELGDALGAWFAAAPADPAEGWTRAELEAHARDEHSTFSWLLEPMLQRAGFLVRDAWYSDSRTYARYVCVKA